MSLALARHGAVAAVRRRAAAVAAALTDTFTRADSATTLGSTETGQVWIAASGVWGVSTNRAYKVSGADGSLAITDAGLTDAFVSAILTRNGTGSNGSPGIVARSSADGAAYYGVDTASGGVRLIKQGAALGSLASSFADGDTIGIRVVGTSVKAFVNGVERVAVTDTTNTTGTHAGMRALDDVAPRWDNFRAEAP